jgi:hypothetical protein
MRWQQFKKMGGVGFGMKPNYICPKHSVKKLFAPGQNSHQLLRGKRHMPENTDGQVAAMLAHQVRDQGEMEILHPQQVAGACFVAGNAREGLINAHVAAPLRR